MYRMDKEKLPWKIRRDGCSFHPSYHHIQAHSDYFPNDVSCLYFSSLVEIGRDDECVRAPYELPPRLRGPFPPPSSAHAARTSSPALVGVVVTVLHSRDLTYELCVRADERRLSLCALPVACESSVSGVSVLERGAALPLAEGRPLAVLVLVPCRPAAVMSDESGEAVRATAEVDWVWSWSGEIPGRPPFLDDGRSQLSLLDESRGTTSLDEAVLRRGRLPEPRRFLRDGRLLMRFAWSGCRAGTSGAGSSMTGEGGAAGTLLRYEGRRCTDLFTVEEVEKTADFWLTALDDLDRRMSMYVSVSESDSMISERAGGGYQMDEPMSLRGLEAVDMRAS